MPKIKLEQLKEGMTVAADIKNMDDMLLIPAGCVLTERHIRVLQTWGIPDVQVEATSEADAPVDPLSQILPEDMARLTQEVKSRFWKLDETLPAEMEVLRLMVRRKALASLA